LKEIKALRNHPRRGGHKLAGFNMDSSDSNSVISHSSARVYILSAICLTLMLIIFAAYFRAADCQQYLYSAQYLQQQYGIAPRTCFQNYLNKALIPSVVIASPLVFLLGILFLKEKKKQYLFTKTKQERIAFWLSIFTLISFLLSLALIKSIPCEGFACIALGPLIAASFTVFPPLFFGFSLWFFRARYQWEKRKFLAVTVGLILLLLLAYAQTPLL
jgi:hypothetical protein